VINQITHDFRLLDVWALPVEGRREEFGTFVEGMALFDPADSDSAVSRALFALRRHAGRWLGLDDRKERPIPGCNETTLRDRLPGELRGSAGGILVGDMLTEAGFAPLYGTADEWAAEITNATVHGVLHLAWVDRGDGRYQAQMAIYAKPRGVLGQGYMLLIAPFRHSVVYPALMRQIERAWSRRPQRSDT